MRSRKTLVAAMGTLACCALLSPAAGAAVIDVEITADTSAEDNQCSLREALRAAETNTAIEPGNGQDDCPAGDDDNTVDEVRIPSGTYALSGDDDENLNATGDFDLLSFTGSPGDPGPLWIIGTLGAGEVPATVIDAADLDRVFDVRDPGAGETSVIEIRNLTLRNGRPMETNSHGGAILIRDDDAQFRLETARIENSDALGWGGGMSVNSSSAVGADVDVTQVEFSGNTAVDDGGALWVDGPEDIGSMDVRRSAFVGNHSDQMGGAIYVKSDGDTDNEPVVGLYNSTLSGNTADVDGGAIAFAFGLGGTMFIESSTIAGNSTPAAGKAGGIATQPAVDEFIQGGGVIMSGNTAAGQPANCVLEPLNEFGGGGGSIESGPSACFPASTIADPLLAPLSYNAVGDQTTRTHGLYDGSPALDLRAAIFCDNASDAQGTDQRGVARPAGGLCDAGAFEGSVGPAPGSSPPAADPPATTTTKKKCKKKKKKKKGKSVAGAAKKKKKKGCKKKKKKRKK